MLANFLDALADRVKSSNINNWDWVVTYPSTVIGVARGNSMNLATSLGLYVAISKRIDGNLVFPGSETFYTLFDTFTSSRLHARFALWAALKPKCGDQAFDVVNGDVESWQNFWPKLAARFRCHVTRNQSRLDVGEGADGVVLLAEEPPMKEMGVERGFDREFWSGGGWSRRLIW